MIPGKPTDRARLVVPCPFCKAPAGSRCYRGRDGYLMPERWQQRANWVHTVRVPPADVTEAAA